MHPTLFSIGRFGIPSYTVLLDLGIILGLVMTYIEGRRLLKNTEIALDLGLWTVIGGILGGRLGHVLAHLSTYSEDWIRALRIWEGGLSFHGAVLGGLLVLGIFAVTQRRKEVSHSFWELADVVTLGIALGLAFGWAGCLLGGCGYGIPGEGFGFLNLPDIHGIEANRFATQIFSLGVALLLFVAFWLLRRRWPFAGAAFLMLVLLTFASQFFLESKRYDEAIYVGPWRLQQVFDLSFALVAAVGLLVLWWQAREAEEEPGEFEEAAEEAADLEELVEAADGEDDDGAVDAGGMAPLEAAEELAGIVEGEEDDGIVPAVDPDEVVPDEPQEGADNP